MLTCGSPQLIAAYRVLLRQSVPWHPPCALVRLILPVHVEHYFLRLLRVVFNKDCLLFVSSLCSFQGASKSLSAFRFRPFGLPFLFRFRSAFRLRFRFYSVSILQNDTEINHFACQTPLTCWPTLSTPCVVVASSVRGLPVFPASCN